MAKGPDQRYATTVELARAAREATTVPSVPGQPSSRPGLAAGAIHYQDTQLAATEAAPAVRPPPPPGTGSRRKWLIAALVVLLVAAAGIGGVFLWNVLSPKASAAELVLTGATDPGANSFMPPAASPPPTNTVAPPTLAPHGEGTTVATQPLPGDRDGLYGGTLNNAECDRDKMITFLSAHPAQAGAFVEALNTDPTMPTTGQGNQPDIDGTYREHLLTATCPHRVDRSISVTHQGNMLTFVVLEVGVTFTGTLNADGSFQVSVALRGGNETIRGVFVTEGGRTVIRDGTYQSSGGCSGTREGIKQ
jgi:hypothetical protein